MVATNAEYASKLSLVGVRSGIAIVVGGSTTTSALRTVLVGVDAAKGKFQLLLLGRSGSAHLAETSMEALHFGHAVSPANPELGSAMTNPYFTTKGCSKRGSETINDNRSLPFNSCGERCMAALPCNHACPNVCHPGPCEDCRLCGRYIPRRRNLPRDSLELRRDRAAAAWIRYQGFNRTDDAVITNDHAPSSAAPQTLSARIWVPLAISLAVTVSMAGPIFGLTMVVVEPYNHRSIAMNNDAMRAAWVLLALGALINLCANWSLLPRLRLFWAYWKEQILDIPVWACALSSQVIVAFGELVLFVLAIVFLAINLAWLIGPLVLYGKVKIG